MNMNSHLRETEVLRQIRPLMIYDGGTPLPEWQAKAREKLNGLLGLPLEGCPDDFRAEYDVVLDGHREIRFTFQSEPGYYVPCQLLLPLSPGSGIPLTLCQSGHGAGMHIAFGQIKKDKDAETLKSWPHRAMALRAIRDGRAALCVEARNFGESSLEGYGTSCTESAKIALLTGRTALGGRVWDSMRALDVIERRFPEIDLSDLVCTGNSGGGTTTYYLACLDERIKFAAPSCSVCTFADSIGAMPHCMCNYVPGIAKYFDMGHMAAMIAPRHLVVAAGREDTIFPIYGVLKCFDQIRRIYDLAGCPDRCRLVIGPSGHFNYADEIWEAIGEMRSGGERRE